MSTTLEIDEVVWSPGQRPVLDEALSRSPFESTEEWDRRWAAYLPSEPPTIVLSQRHLERDEDFPPLEGHIREVNPEGFNDYLFAADTYYQSRVLGDPLPDPGSIEPSPDPIIQDMIAPSRGLLLWQFQLESLAQTLGLGRREAIRLRRHINQKRPDPLRLLKERPPANQAFPSGCSLREVVQKRLYYGAALPGQWRAARLLLGAG